MELKTFTAINPLDGICQEGNKSTAERNNGTGNHVQA